MPIIITDNGQDNHVQIDPEVSAKQDGSIIFNGSNNTVTIEAGCTSARLGVRLGNGCSFHAGSGCRLAALDVFTAKDGRVRIGANVKFTWRARLHLHEHGEIGIGEGSLIASETLMMTSDMHSILNKATGLRLNPPGDIRLGERVWLGERVTVLKGTIIGAESIVGYGSVISGIFPHNCLVAGSPGRVIREGVSWQHELIDDYQT